MKESENGILIFFIFFFFSDTDNQYEALYPFVARVETELSINKGDLILCKECLDKKGWMRGVNDRTKQEGWVPATYVKKVRYVLLQWYTGTPL